MMIAEQTDLVKTSEAFRRVWLRPLTQPSRQRHRREQAVPSPLPPACVRGGARGAFLARIFHVGGVDHGHGGGDAVPV